MHHAQTDLELSGLSRDSHPDLSYLQEKDCSEVDFENLENFENLRDLLCCSFLQHLFDLFFSLSISDFFKGVFSQIFLGLVPLAWVFFIPLLPLKFPDLS